MQHNLKFGGFYLNSFLLNCVFLNDTTVKYTYLENKEINLSFKKLNVIELKGFVKDAGIFLKKEPEDLIPGDGNFFKNFQI